MLNRQIKKRRVADTSVVNPGYPDEDCGLVPFCIKVLCAAKLSHPVLWRDKETLLLQIKRLAAMIYRMRVDTCTYTYIHVHVSAGGGKGERYYIIVNTRVEMFLCVLLNHAACPYSFDAVLIDVWAPAQCLQLARFRAVVLPPTA